MNQLPVMSNTQYQGAFDAVMKTKQELQQISAQKKFNDKYKLSKE